MPRLFGTDGVRGVINQDMTPDLALRLGKAIGTKFGRGSKVLVGRDVRSGGDMLVKAVEAGLLSVGVKVFEGGMAPTPALQYATKTLEYDGAVIVTASHNPPEYNGIKVVANDGIEVDREVEEEIESYFFENRFNTTSWSESYGEVKKEDRVVETYVNGILSHVDTAKVRSKGYRVLIDPANSVGAITSPLVARALASKVYTINGHLDPLFPARVPEPTFESLTETSNVVKALRPDLAVAHDGDADRAIFLDENGVIHWGDRSGTLLSYWAHEKNPNLPKRIFTAVSSSSLVEEYLGRYGIGVEWLKVGSVGIARELQRKGGVAGFEENGGFMYPPHQFVRDGAMSMALMLELMAFENESLSSLFSRLPKYYLVKTKVPLKGDVNKAYESVRNAFSSSARKIITIDGIKVISDDFWFLVRKSGTEPIVRVFVEAKDESQAKELANELIKLVGESQ
jgi:phosphomannomutase/phosphoglucomutase